MSEFGYIPESPEQSFGNNKGIFSPTDIYNLTIAEEFTNYGQLELIETKTISSATADFVNLQGSKYKTHFFTFTDIHFGSQSEHGFRLSIDEGSSFLTGYQFANQRGIENGTFSERKSTSQDTVRLFGDIGSNALSAGNGYMYLYNASDSAKYTFSTGHFSFRDSRDKCAFEWGSGLYATSNEVNAIRFGLGTTCSAIASGIISCYGIRFA